MEALAAAQDGASQEITACVKRIGGAVRIVESRSECDLSSEAVRFWNTQGERGPRGRRGPRGLAGGQGKPGIAGYKIVKYSGGIGAGGLSVASPLKCPSGYRATGGGGRGAGPVYIHAMWPEDDGEEWWVMMKRDREYDFAHSYTTWAICVR